MTLTLTNLTKQYGNFTALENFTYDFTAGVYGLLGPNGAGKSTLMNIITDNLKPTSGSVKFDGVETSTMDADFRKILGFMPQQQGIYPNFTLERFLYYMAALKGMKKADAKPQIEKLINLVNLQDSRNKRLGGFSGGIIGIIVSYGASFLVNFVAQRQGSTMQSAIPIWLALGGIAFSTAVGVIAGYLPAKRAMKLSALMAIKTE